MRFVLVATATLLAMFLVSSAGLIPSLNAEQRARSLKPGERCWKDPEISNPDVGGRKAPSLPEKFYGAKVRRMAVLIKLCVDPAGQVARTIVLTSSGNKSIDEFYQETLSKWVFKPFPSATVVPAAVLWHSR